MTLSTVAGMIVGGVVGELMPHGLCIITGLVMFLLAALDGYIGTQSGKWRDKATLMLITLNAVVGVIVGGYIGASPFTSSTL